MTKLKNIWGPCAYQVDDLRPWHNLPAVIGATPPHNAMQGLSLAYAISSATEAAHVPVLQKAAYRAWQEGHLGKAFEMAVKPHMEKEATETTFDVVAAMASLAQIVKHFGGGEFLAEGLMFIVSGDAEIAQPMGIAVEAAIPESMLAGCQRLLAMWSAGLQGKKVEASTLNDFIYTLSQLTPAEIAELPKATRQVLQRLHKLHIARLFAGGMHLADAPLEAATQNIIKQLKPIVTHPAVTVLGVLEKPNMWGSGGAGLLAKVAAEGLYLWPHPRLIAGEVLSEGQTEAIQKAYLHQNLTEVLTAVFQSRTYQDLPKENTLFKTPRLNRRAVLECLINLTPTTQGDN